MTRSRRKNRPAWRAPDAPASVRVVLDRCDLFLFTAVATVLVVRSILALTGYPQLGGGGLHIAHVLWGGLLMVIGIIATQVYPGSRVRIVAAFVGGIGFGLFIDEVGKFVTADVNYFFEPAVAIMYATFVALYLGVRVVVKLRPMTDRRRLAIAAQALVDLSLGQLDAARRGEALTLLAGVDAHAGQSGSAAMMYDALASAPATQPGLSQKLTGLIDRGRTVTTSVLGTPLALKIVLAVLLAQAVSVIVNVVIVLFGDRKTGLVHALLGTGIATTAVGALTVAGVALVLRRRRSQLGLELLEWSLIIELLFVQVSVFNREQWLGLVGFAASAIMLAVIRLTLRSAADRPSARRTANTGQSSASPYR